jgi:LPXTG-motif cell wall-anchored protein
MLRKLLLSASVAGVLMCLPSRSAVAQTVADQPVNLTFSGPVSVPGHTLPAGKYMFKMMSGRVDRQSVQIYDDTGKTIAVVTAIAAARANGDPVPEKPEVNFYETSPGTPQAIRMWWYPGIRSGGHEFIYPHAQAEQIAKATKAAVLTWQGTDDSGKLVRMTANGETDVNNTTGVVPTEPTTMAKAETPAPASPRRALPKTASDLPIVLAAGLASLCAGVVLFARRRVA